MFFQRTFTTFKTQKYYIVTQVGSGGPQRPFKLSPVHWTLANRLSRITGLWRTLEMIFTHNKRDLHCRPYIKTLRLKIGSTLKNE